MSNHTKGPWTVLPDVDLYRDSRRIFADSHYIGIIGNSDDTQDVTMANSRLIAAAPELLSALVLLVSEQDNDGVPRDVPWYDDVWDIAKEAIAKAKGERHEQRTSITNP